MYFKLAQESIGASRVPTTSPPYMHYKITIYVLTTTNSHHTHLHAHNNEFTSYPFTCSQHTHYMLATTNSHHTHLHAHNTPIYMLTTHPLHARNNEFTTHPYMYSPITLTTTTNSLLLHSQHTPLQITYVIHLHPKKHHPTSLLSSILDSTTTLLSPLQDTSPLSLSASYNSHCNHQHSTVLPHMDTYHVRIRTHPAVCTCTN